MSSYSQIGGGAMDAISPKSKVLMPGRSGSGASIIKGSDPRTVLQRGPVMGDRSAGTSRFDLTSHSLNRGGKRKM